MRVLIPLVILCLSPNLPADTRLVRETDALTPEREQARLRVPEGFEVQLFAAEPQINKPINMAFDARGRLWVSSTAEYPYAAAQDRWTDAQGSFVRDSRDAIKILEDTNGDGRADKVSDFADSLNIPTGVLPWHKPEHHAGCIAWSIPNIWYFADTDGDGKADLREVLFGPLGYEKDTHGMCSSFRLGFDGWVYATHGFSNTSQLKTKSGATLELNSGNVFRFRPDASEVELWSAGQVNPFGLAWDRYGNLYSADCHSSPVYQLLRGAHYPSFGKPHDGLGFGPVMCRHTHGSTGICGIVYLDGGVWGPERNDRVLVGNVVTSKINQDHVVFKGSTPVAKEEPDFLVSEDPWFRPVDLQLGPDGALYIADFYNKIIGHYEVPLNHPGRDRERGRIWRVAKKTPHQRPPTTDEAAEAILALKRLGSSGELSAPERAELTWKLHSNEPGYRRAAAEVLYGHPALETIQPLLAALQDTPEEDASLVHGLRLALRESLKLPGALASQPDNAVLLGIALAVPTAEAAHYLSAHGDLSRSEVQAHLVRNLPKEKLPDVIQALRQRNAAATPAIKTLHDGLLERGLAPPPELLDWTQQTAFALLGQIPAQPQWEPVMQKTPQPAWSVLPRAVEDGDEAPALQSMGGGGGAEESRTGILQSRLFAAPARLEFMLCGHRGFAGNKAHDKNLVRLVNKKGATLRTAFPPRSDALQPVSWDLADLAGQNVRLEIVDGDDGKAYAWLGIAAIKHPDLSVADFSKENETRQALRTLASLLPHHAPSILRERLAPFLPARPAPPPSAVSPEQRAALDQLIAARAAAFEKAAPDSAKGASIFTANCAACHQIGGEGGLLGPQLDGIGARGAARLCEDILDPNRNVDAHFHVHLVTRKDGSTLSGFLKASAGQALILVDAAGTETRIAKSDIHKDTVMPLSLMPAVFGQTLPEGDFLHLLAWLLSK